MIFLCCFDEALCENSQAHGHKSDETWAKRCADAKHGCNEPPMQTMPEDLATSLHRELNNNQKTLDQIAWHEKKTSLATSS